MIGLLAAPTNLGLRPPAPTSVPGTSKAPEALREAGFYRRLEQIGANDHGNVLPGRYVDDVAPALCAIKKRSSTMLGAWPAGSISCVPTGRPRW